MLSPVGKLMGSVGGGYENLILKSEELDSGSWSKIGTTISADAIVAPDGNTTADKVIEDGSVGGHLVNQTPAAALLNATTYTGSAHMKAGDNGFMFLLMGGTAFPTAAISVNLTTGVVSNAAGTPLNKASQTLADGWFRVWFSLATTSAAAGTLSTYLTEDGVWANRNYAGDSASGDYAWGMQLVKGGSPGTYTPTA